MRSADEQSADEGFRDFVYSNWAEVAAAAWRAFQAKGPGALVIPETALGAWDTASEAFASLTGYVPASSGDFSVLGAEVVELVRSYDPASSIVAVCEAANGRLLSFSVFSMKPSPPDAHRSQTS